VRPIVGFEGGHIVERLSGVMVAYLMKSVVPTVPVWSDFVMSVRLPGFTPVIRRHSVCGTYAVSDSGCGYE
jgi:hypothetical protein